ncbi:MAG TPA: hotdog domain-containing protein [Trebonia sp.]|jgi:acyl-coenzyme A thioesterase PaaI-like protein
MPRRSHLLQELGFAVRQDGEALHGSASVTPYMQVPGVPCVRASILASWADMLCGMLSMRAFGGRVSVTLELDVHLYRPAPGAGTVTAVGRQVKAGRSVFVGEVEFADADGEMFGFSTGSFMVAPDTTLRPPRLTGFDVPPSEVRLRMPLAERADCKRQAPGVAVLHKSEDGLNAARTVHGGLIALAAEEAVLSLAPGTSLSSLAVRYLQPVRVGPAVATASVRDGLGRVSLRDSGNGDRLAVTATTRTF